MSGDARYCSNCGNKQAVGDFCEKCGTRMVAADAVAATTVAQGAVQQSAPPQGASQAGANAPTSPPPYEYGDQAKNFFGRLFDLSFKEFITPSITPVLFVLLMVGIFVWYIFMVVIGFQMSAGAGLGFLFGGLVGAFILLVYGRVMLETTVVFFRIHDHTEEIAKKKR